MNKTLKILYTVIIVILLLLVTNYKIRISDDIYRHNKILESINLNKNFYDTTKYFYRNYGNIIFYDLLYLIKKMNISIKALQYLTVIIYYFLGYLNLKKQSLRENEKILLLVIIFLIVNPFYIATLVHYPLAIIFIILSIYFENKNYRKIEILCLVLAYLTHTGTIYIIAIYIISKAKFMQKLIFNKKLMLFSIIIALILKKYLLENIILYLKIILNNVYLNNKIDAYFLKESQSTLYGGLGKGGLISIFYFIIISLSSYLKTVKKNKITTFYYLLLFVSIFLSTFSMIFMVRSTFLLIIIYPNVYVNCLKKKFQNILIFLSLIFIIEYRFLLNFHY